jgi:hypothetical protein
MDMPTKINKITKFSTLAIAWIGKAAIFFVLVAVLGFTQNLYGVDVRLSTNTPMVQVRVILSDSMPHPSWRKVVNFTHSMFHPAAAHEQACRENQKQNVG